MNIDNGDTPLVLLYPAWKNWGMVEKLKTNSVGFVLPSLQ